MSQPKHSSDRVRHRTASQATSIPLFKTGRWPLHCTEQNLARGQMGSLDGIKEEYERLSNLPPHADALEKRRRGYEFERLLNKLFVFDQLEPGTDCRPAGEQIDGSIYLDGRTYLLEARRHADPLAASTLYQFKGKVDGKLAGTIGTFISMSGYAADAVDALVLGKASTGGTWMRRSFAAAASRPY